MKTQGDLAAVRGEFMPELVKTVPSSERPEDRVIMTGK
jgi:hypothetical protein